MTESPFRTQDARIRNRSLERNRARCRKCKDVIESKFRHDFVTCKCGAISVDGGHDYQRLLGNINDFDFMEDES